MSHTESAAILTWQERQQFDDSCPEYMKTDEPYMLAEIADLRAYCAGLMLGTDTLNATIADLRAALAAVPGQSDPVAKIHITRGAFGDLKEAKVSLLNDLSAGEHVLYAAPVVLVDRNAVQSIDTDEFRKLCDAYHCASQSELEDRYYAIVYHVDEEVHGMANSWSTLKPAAPASVPHTFPERDQSKPAEQQGIFRKFEVRRVDGSDQPGGKHYGCRYFIIDLDHDQHAPTAMRTYAAECAATHPQLAADLVAEFGSVAPSVQDAPSDERPDVESCTPKRWSQAEAEAMFVECNMLHGLVYKFHQALGNLDDSKHDVCFERIKTLVAAHKVAPVVAWHYQVDDHDGEGYQPTVHLFRPLEHCDNVRNVRPLVFGAAPVSGEVVARPDPEPPDTASQKQIADWHARQIPDQTGEKQ